MSTGELPLSAAAELAELSALSSSLGFGGASSHGDEPLEELPTCEALFSVPGAPALTGSCRTPATASVAAALTPSVVAAAATPVKSTLKCERRWRPLSSSRTHKRCHRRERATKTMPQPRTSDKN